MGSPKDMAMIKVKVQEAMMVQGDIKIPDANGEIEMPQELAESLGLIETEKPKTATKAKQNATTDE
jgi:hypothetical protein